MRDIKWWLSRLEGVRQGSNSNSWIARCPAHDDRDPSLSLTVDPHGEVLVHCFAGCSYQDILNALTPSINITSVSSREIPENDPPIPAKVWWEEYTRVPTEEWESWGARFEGTSIHFIWEGIPAVKTRRARTKEFQWSAGVHPPLWPKVPDSLPETIWLTEGESDCGVLRHLSLPAFAVTRGAQGSLSEEVWDQLKSRGARQVILAFDQDTPGQDGVRAFEQDALNRGLQVQVLRLPVDALLGEKDIRDLYLRIGPSLKDHLLRLVLPSDSDQRTARKVSLEEFLSMRIPETTWLVENVWLEHSTGLISGPPKSGKSWLALDLGVSVATGSPFLGQFTVPNPGPVAFVTSEDPDPLLQDRLEKIMIAKGYGGSVHFPKVSLPLTQMIPFYLDLERDFTFSPEGEAKLFSWLDGIFLKHGYLALVIFDPVLRFLPQGIDEYKASEVGGIFQTASRIYSRYQAGTLLVHHKSKATVENKGSYGSIAFGAFSESALYLTPTSEGVTDWVNALGEFKSAPQMKWAYRFRDLQERYSVEVSLEGHQIPDGVGRRNQVFDEILRVLRESPDGLLVPEILQFLPKFSEYQIRWGLKELKKRNRVDSRLEDQPGKKGPRRERWYAV